MTSQLQEFCAVCGRIADDIHHGRIHDISQGKGSGGTSLDDAEHFHHIPLDRSCHQALHDKRLRIEIDDEGIVTAEWAGGGVVVRDLRSDSELCALWVDGDAYGRTGIVMQARAALAFKQRYGAYGMHWADRVATMIREHGCAVSERTVYNRADLGMALLLAGDDASRALDMLANVGQRALEAVGRAEDPEAALAQAEDMRDDGARITAVAKALRDSATGASSPKCEDTGVHVCRYCGWEHGFPLEES